MKKSILLILFSLILVGVIIVFFTLTLKNQQETLIYETKNQQETLIDKTVIENISEIESSNNFDYDSRGWRYISKDKLECQRNRYDKSCEIYENPFQDGIGCGCIKDALKSTEECIQAETNRPRVISPSIYSDVKYKEKKFDDDFSLSLHFNRKISLEDVKEIENLGFTFNISILEGWLDKSDYLFLIGTMEVKDICKLATIEYITKVNSLEQESKPL